LPIAAFCGLKTRGGGGGERTMRVATAIGAALLAGVLTVPSAQPTFGQPPSYPPSTEADAIAQCLCLHRDLGELSATMAAKRRVYDQLQAELGQTDARLQHERATIDVNNPDAVAQFSQELAMRDALFRRANGPAATELSAAVARYNAAVSQYNTQCANRPRDAVILSQVEAHLVCPAR
jgi:hypothetical protein